MRTRFGWSSPTLSPSHRAGGGRALSAILALPLLFAVLLVLPACVVEQEREADDPAALQTQEVEPTPVAPPADDEVEQDREIDLEIDTEQGELEVEDGRTRIDLDPDDDDPPGQDGDPPGRARGPGGG